ncbi:hypothetical protein NK6_6608 [Bradyrhizobium diazoefficiens]|uniref:Uncharacterized protein n=1 Tax=Bradyrhizobium diazoefficiens TaxID=1355477 RepID=A0A0E4G065_9BRAD|nr:hypothetical protein NK6_6608 [Bradyrhizobium diazoefficiens]
MVPMTMGQNDTEKAATGGGKPIDVGQRCGSKVLGVQRKTEIEQDSAPLALQLDTSAANLPRPPMDSQFHYATSPRSFQSPYIQSRPREIYTLWNICKKYLPGEAPC